MTIHTDMLALQSALRTEDIDIAVREDAEDLAWHDAEYDAWLDSFLGDAYEAWLDDVEPDYVPFQLDAAEYSDCVGNVTAEPGYLESTAPYLF